MEAAGPAAVNRDYPVRLDVEYPEHLSRWKIFVKWLLAIPHFIIVYLLQIVLGVLAVIAFFTILFTGNWPRGMFDLAVSLQRWTANVAAYGLLLLRDEYPPFSGEPGEYPVQFDIDYPEEGMSRLLIFVKWLLVIPHLIVLFFVLLAVTVVVIVAFFAILFTGRYPRGMFDFVVGAMRWTTRVNAYGQFLMTDRYPPFDLE